MTDRRVEVLCIKVYVDRFTTRWVARSEEAGVEFEAASAAEAFSGLIFRLGTEADRERDSIVPPPEKRVVLFPLHRVRKGIGGE